MAGEQNDETDAAYQKDEGFEVKQTAGKLRQALPDSVGLGPGAQQDMGLASDDADADGGGKQGGDSASHRESRQYLQSTRDDNRCQDIAIPGPMIALAQGLYGGVEHSNQAGSGAGNTQRHAIDVGDEKLANDGSDDARDGGKS